MSSMHDNGSEVLKLFAPKKNRPAAYCYIWSIIRYISCEQLHPSTSHVRRCIQNDSTRIFYYSRNRTHQRSYQKAISYRRTVKRKKNIFSKTYWELIYWDHLEKQNLQKMPHVTCEEFCQNICREHCTV